MDASVHDSLDQRPQVLVIHRALGLHKAALVATEDHGLVLQVALAALVTDRAVQGVVDLQGRAASRQHAQHKLSRADPRRR